MVNKTTDSITDSLSDTKTNQLSNNDSNQLHIKTGKNDYINNIFIICHQCIRGLKGKLNEFILSLPAEAPHLICFTEHHLKENKLDNTHDPKYKLCANYCRKNLKHGVYVFGYMKI
jgi:hypothetical protein